MTTLNSIALGVVVAAIIGTAALAQQPERSTPAAIQQPQQQTRVEVPVTANEAFLTLSANTWIAIFTVVLAVVAALQALIYFLQLRTTHRAERAYVYVDGISNLENFG